MKAKLEKAIEYIIGYCEKHPSCKYNCKFYGDDGMCMFWKADSPVDWKREDGAE